MKERKLRFKRARFINKLRYIIILTSTVRKRITNVWMLYRECHARMIHDIIVCNTMRKYIVESTMQTKISYRRLSRIDCVLHYMLGILLPVL